MSTTKTFIKITRFSGSAMEVSYVLELDGDTEARIPSVILGGTQVITLQKIAEEDLSG